MGEPLGSGRNVVHFLQFLPRPQVVARNSGDGSGDSRPRVECPRTIRGRMTSTGIFPVWQKPPPKYVWGSRIVLAFHSRLGAVEAAISCSLWPLPCQVAALFRRGTAIILRMPEDKKTLTIRCTN